jgi:hypothetical protein
VERGWEACEVSAPNGLPTGVADEQARLVALAGLKPHKATVRQASDILGGPMLTCFLGPATSGMPEP